MANESLAEARAALSGPRRNLSGSEPEENMRGCGRGDVASGQKVHTTEMYFYLVRTRNYHHQLKLSARHYVIGSEKQKGEREKK